MSELETLKMEEIGEKSFGRLLGVLSAREANGFNAVGWSGTSTELQELVEAGELCPSSSFAVVAEGMNRYKRIGTDMVEDTDSVRKLSEIMGAGADDYRQARQIDENVLVEQIKGYLLAHGGEFQDGTDWVTYIQDISNRLLKKANAIDVANR